jgi:hypothetical protein
VGYFSNTKLEPASAAPAALTKDRIKKALEARGWSYHVDSDGDIGGGWEDGTFWFFTYGDKGEILQVRGIWRGRLPMAEWDRAVAIANDWNCDKLFPKTYARATDAGEAQMICEHSLDYEHGVTDEQLDMHLRTAIGTGGDFFEKLNEEFPAAAAAAKGE